MWDRERGEHGHRITPKVRLVLASFKSAKLTYQIQKMEMFFNELWPAGQGEHSGKEIFFPQKLMLQRARYMQND